MVFHEEHEVFAIPAGAWNDEAVAAEKGHGGADLLRPALVAALVQLDLDTQSFQVAHDEKNLVCVNPTECSADYKEVSP